MKFSLSLLAAVLATSSLASPQGRVQRRATRAHQSTPKKLPKHPHTNTSHTDYSSNWGGAVIKTPPAGQAFNAVSATFTVPTPSIPPNGMGTGESFAAAAWVGIDGDTYSNAILQTGIDFNVGADGSVSFDAWYEWFPDYSYNFNNIEVNAGDVISLSVTATTPNSGVALVQNQSNGQQASIDLTSDYALGGQNAEWIVEDFEENDQLVAFADFGMVTFIDCVATTQAQDMDLDTATVIEIGDAGGQLTGVTMASASTVIVTYQD